MIALLTKQQYRIDDICAPISFLRALPLILKAEDLLVFASYNVGSRPKVVSFLKRHQLPPDDIVIRENKYLVDEDYPEAFAVLWQAKVELLRELAGLLKGSTNAVDLCHHVAAYGPRGPLFNYHDAFSGDPFYISTNVSEAEVKAFCKSIRKTYAVQAEEI